MNEREKLIEAIVDAFWQVDDDDGYQVMARAALSAIEGMGCVVVPRNPTEAMIEAGSDYDRDEGRIPMSDLLYQDAIAASPFLKEPS